MAALRPQLVAQLERRLFLAFKLGLHSLEDKLVTFIRDNAEQNKRAVSDSYGLGILLTEENRGEIFTRRLGAVAAARFKRMREWWVTFTGEEQVYG
jgi:hypothetical protein